MACGELANDSSAVAKYWRYLSSNRISRTGKFTSVLKSVMLNHWSEILQKQRKSRYLARFASSLLCFHHSPHLDVLLVVSDLRPSYLCLKCLRSIYPLTEKSHCVNAKF